MENSEKKTQDENQFQAENQIFASPEIAGYLLTTSKWGKFLAIVGYVVMALMIIFGIIMIVSTSLMNALPNSGFIKGIMGFVYVIIGAVYFFPVTYLLRYSVRIKKGLNSDDVQSITSGFENLKSLFKFTGIFTIVMLAIYVVIFIFIIISGVFF